MKQIRHIIGTAIIVAGLTVGIGLWLQAVIARMPLGGSEQAVVIEGLLSTHFWAIAFLFALIGGVMLYSILFFRQKKGQMEYGDHIEGNTPLELFWTIVPTIAVIYFAVIGGQTLSQIEMADPDAMRVNVTGQQWQWSFEYPEFGITSTELHLPVDEQVLLRLRSVDVIHSFWVAELGPKQDLLPGGEVRELRLTPTETATLELRCAELCGRRHALMHGVVIIESRADFDAWVQKKIAENPCTIGDTVGCGAKLAQETGCLACHSTDGSSLVGPTWQGLFGKQETLTDGTTLTVDADYLLNSIREPGSQIVSGFQDLMPVVVGEKLTDEDIAAIIAYIQTLK